MKITVFTLLLKTTVYEVELSGDNWILNISKITAKM